MRGLNYIANYSLGASVMEMTKDYLTAISTSHSSVWCQLPAHSFDGISVNTGVGHLITTSQATFRDYAQ